MHRGVFSVDIETILAAFARPGVWFLRFSMRFFAGVDRAGGALKGGVICLGWWLVI